MMQPNRPTKLALVAGFLLFLSSICWLIVTHNSVSKLSYQGKPLGYWFNQLPMTSIHTFQGHDSFAQSARKRAKYINSGAVQEYGSWLEEPEISKRAIRAIGTNGIAFYLSKLRKPRVGSFRKTIQDVALAIGSRRFLYPDVDAERDQAVTALILLKPLPEAAERELLITSTNKSVEMARAARCVLVGEPGQLPLTRDLDEAIRSHLENKASWR